MTITVEGEGDGPPVTTLTGTLDQAAWRACYAGSIPWDCP
jgi:hypothetical protein